MTIKSGIVHEELPESNAIADAEENRLKQVANRESAFGLYRNAFKGHDLSLERFRNLYPDHERKFDEL